MFSEIAERIYRELLNEIASIWYISDEYGAKVMVKIPSQAIKSLIKGCPIRFTFGKNTLQNPYKFHTGVQIHDDPKHFLSVTGMQRFPDEHSSLKKIMNRDKTSIHFHNELTVCVATAELTFEIKDQLQVLNLLGSTKELYNGEFDEMSKLSLDSFDYSLGSTRPFKNPYTIHTLTIEGKLDNWIIMQNHFVGLNDQNKVEINSQNEGETFEREIWAALESTFDWQIFKNPRIPFKGQTRELTDILGYSDYGIFLFETKAASILQTDIDRTMERKVANLQAHIKKAIRQVVGAAKKISENVPIHSSTGQEIVFNRQLLAHCVILVSELYSFGDWKEIEMTMFKAMIENKIYLNVMDMNEFMKFVRVAGGNKDHLDYHLIKRTEAFVKHQSIQLNSHFVTQAEYDKQTSQN